MKKLSKSLILLPLLCVCACSSLNNNNGSKETINKSEYSSKEDNNDIVITNGAIEVYSFSNYGTSNNAYHLLTTYDSPCSLSNCDNYFTITKDSNIYYYSIPMFQYYFVLGN